MFRQMTGAQILSSMTVTICLLVDSIVIGRLIGLDAMSAYGLANPIIIIFTSLGTMAAVGVQVRIGDVIGRGDMKGCGTVFSTSVAFSLILAAIWIAAVFAASQPLCIILGAGRPAADNQVFTMTEDYLKGFILGAPFYFLSQIMTPYLQVAGKRKLILISTVTMTVTDTVLDLLSVFVFHNGMFGIGLASALSYLAALAAGLVYFLRKDCMFRLDLKTVNVKTAVSIVHGGSPVIINQACFTVRIYVINQILLGVSGTDAVAVFSVVSTMGSIIFSIGLGAGSITLMLASIFYSEEDRTSLNDLIRAAVPYSMKLIISAVMLVELLAPWLSGAFPGNDPDVLSIAVTALRLFMLSRIPCVLTTVLKSYYQGIGHMRFTNLISICNNAVLPVPVVWLLSRAMGVTGVWIGLVVSEILSLLIISVIVWARCGCVSFTAEAYSLLDNDFGADPSDVYETSIADVEHAVIASDEINEFCRRKGMEKRTSMLISLCVEEIVVNIIEHGFTKDDHIHNADIRLLVDDKKCIIRVRDNCIGFDPTKYMELHQSNDPAAHIGIRIVMGMVSEINYNNSLGLNNLYMCLE